MQISMSSRKQKKALSAATKQVHALLDKLQLSDFKEEEQVVLAMGAVKYKPHTHQGEKEAKGFVIIATEAGLPQVEDSRQNTSKVGSGGFVYA